MRTFLIFLTVLALATVAGAGVAWNTLTKRLETPYRGYQDAGVFVDVEPGDPMRVIAERLGDVGVVADTWTFRLAVWRSGRDRELQAGEYYFDKPLSPLAVVSKIASGHVYLRSITFPEGLRIAEMARIALMSSSPSRSGRPRSMIAISYAPVLIAESASPAVASAVQ